MRGRPTAAPVALLAICLTFLAVAPAAMGSARIYWGNYTSTGPLSYANLDGSGGANLAISGATVNGPAGMTIDPDTGRLYWTNADVNVISFANADGSGGGNLNTGAATLNYSEGISVFNGKVYFASRDSNTIGWANTDGSGGGNLNTAGADVDQPYGMAVYPAQGRVYWPNYDANSNSISYANLDGSGGGNLNTGAATVELPESVAIDPTANRIYWGNQNFSGMISYANLDGSGGGDLNISGATVDGPIGIAIDPDAGKLYWANYGAPDKLSSANLDGSGGADLVTTGATTANVDYPILLKPPTGTAPPVASGGTATGTTLKCSTGSWAADLISAFLFRAPHSFTYQWSRNGADIGGAVQASIVTTAPGDYRCRVVGSNAAGSASQTSAVHSIGNLARISKLRVSPKKPRRPVKQLVFSMKLSEDAKVTLIVQRKYGRKHRADCKRMTGGTRLKKRCPIYRQVSHTSRQATAGTVKLRLNAGNLSPGAYRATITATNKAGASAPARVVFYRPWW